MRAAAVDDGLLGGAIGWWPRQLELLASLDGPERTHLWSIGRQAGKSSLAACAAVHNATCRADLDAMLPRGRTRYVLVAAPSEDQAREFIRLCEQMVDGSRLLRGLATVRADRIDFALPSGARSAIRALAANSRSVRGMSASLIVIDEMAHFTDTAGPASDERMFAALEPSTRVFGGAARVLVISTPFGETGKFYELFMAAESGVLPSARAHRSAVWVVDTSLDEAWKDARRAEVGEDTFRQEYGAEWVAGGGQFFDLRGVEFDDAPAAPEDGRHWVAGLDPAFHADRHGVALVGESRAEPGVLLVGSVDAIEPGGKLRSLQRRRAREDRTLARVWEIIAPYAPRIVTDQHQADAVQSYFGRLGSSVRVVNLTGPVQTAAFMSLRARMVDGSMRLWRHALLIEELRRVKARDTEAMMLPRFQGGHCDAASALALATFELRGVDGSPPGRASGGPGLMAALMADDLPEGGGVHPRRGRDPDGGGEQGSRPPRGWPGGGGSSWMNEQF